MHEYCTKYTSFFIKIKNDRRFFRDIIVEIVFTKLARYEKGQKISCSAKTIHRAHAFGNRLFGSFKSVFPCQIVYTPYLFGPTWPVSANMTMIGEDRFWFHGGNEYIS